MRKVRKPRPSHVGKIIAFDYRGGTGKGTRVVLVDSVDESHVRGVDFRRLKEDFGAGHRTYKIAQIRGDVTILA